ncbi:NAD(P)-dependent dehydrogenase, short-chain alcohol dehydrogenase family [Sporobacter termitidis DSM 10068]|uniref:NAD(P)-dependent dehydrogenase, short-chain alcohol dehydrogenase family n=1 Tax=Sporobacter termitidis DSM 10068 TaxID=1123282 RepID=A0A1M5WIA5_9FIRM|nr:glucose 1-dehydrogenase [Sporobacter termitidis]SHH87279.1 NAD(P)-dependent dehydrogenase, short-chain alcohol dehydrogenase family [Sporobacter termitidis DSM 10068]
MRLENKAAVVTGASSGMGRAIAALYAAQGAKVLAVARRTDRLEALAKEAEGYPGRISPFAGDMLVKEQAEGIIAEAVKQFGRLDILVNNAGIMDDFSPVGEFSDDIYEKVMKLNLEAPFYSMRAAIKEFEKQGSGVIVNIASVGGLFGGRAGAVYTASKHGLVGLTKNTAFHYGGKNIRCNAICPGSITTEVGSGEFMQKINMDAMNRMMKGTGLINRPGEPDEIAQAALFLASDDSSYINGQAIAVDGGWTAY